MIAVIHNVILGSLLLPSYASVLCVVLVIVHIIQNMGNIVTLYHCYNCIMTTGIA